MNSFTPLSAALGGLLIGLSASALFALNGRIAGISGILGELFHAEDGERDARALFTAGLVAGGVLLFLLAPGVFDGARSGSVGLPVLAGVLVGIGTRIGRGCTSGHGVCGIARGSKRSIVATVLFMGAAGLTTFVVRHVIGSGS
ncbi:MAG: YeeE/YedE family protein [Polyangiaceae bacterium]